MRHLTQVAITALAVLTLSAGSAMAQDNWTHIQDDQYHFAVDLPCAAKASDTPSDADGVVTRSYVCEIDSDNVIEVAVTDFSGKTQGQAVDGNAVLDHVVQSRSEGDVTDSAEPFTLAGAAGRDLRIHNSTAVTRQKLLFRNSMLYQIVSAGAVAKGIPAEDARVQASFKLLN